MNYPNLRLIQHHLATHKLTLLRDKTVQRAQFRKIMRELSVMVCMEALRNLPVTMYRAETTSGAPYSGYVVQEEKIVAISILRTGLVMEEAFMEMAPFAKSGHIGLYHDYENGEMLNYMAFMPGAGTDSLFFIMDGLVGTGDSVKYVADGLMKSGVQASQIRVICLTVSKLGLDEIYGRAEYREMEIYAVDVETDIVEPVDGERTYPAFTLDSIADRLFGTDARPSA